MNDNSPTEQQQKQASFATNLALLTYLESKLEDYEVLTNKNGKPLSFNNAPVSKYKKKMSNNHKLFILEIPLELKRKAIEELVGIGEKGALKEIKEKLNQEGEINKILNLVKEKPDIFGDTTKEVDFVMVGPDIQTGFRILLSTYPKS